MPSAPGAARHPVSSAVGKVGPRAKMLALGAQHDCPDLRRAVEPFERIGDLAHHVGIDEIVWSPPDLDRRDDAGLRDADMLVGCHVAFPALLFRRVALHVSLWAARPGDNDGRTGVGGETG